jgi:hypothetical protein
MSSKPATAVLSKASFALIREVLRSAGLRGVNSAASYDTKRDALAFLTLKFRNGAKTKRALSEALDDRSRRVSATASKEQLDDRPQGEVKR